MAEVKKEEKTTKSSEKKYEKNIWKYTTIALIVIVILLIAVFMWLGNGITGQTTATTLSPEAAANKAVSWMKSYFVSSGSNVSVTLVNASETNDSSVYQFSVELSSTQGQQTQTYYVSKNGDLFFPQAIPTTETVPTQQTQQPGPTTCDQVSKAFTPELDAFVVSNCPYGLQMQRVLVPVEQFFGTKANIKIMYIGSFGNNSASCSYGICSMHGSKEAEENLRQICIREEQNDKYWNYLACYIKNGDTNSCLTNASIDTTKLNTCMNDPTKGLNYAKEDFALVNQYGVQGSPTLILNGVQTSEFNFGGRTADALKTVICCAFSQQPSGCSQKLSTDTASTGFSETYSGGSTTGGTGATCGS